MTTQLVEFPSITLAAVRLAYRKTALRPVTSDYGDGDCGCPLTALYAAADQPLFDDQGPRLGEAVRTWAEKTYGLQQYTCFVDGVDDMATHSPGDLYDHEAFELGQLVREWIDEAKMEYLQAKRERIISARARK